jgi:glycosyltransferase involved in cell wall biosynthesis
MQEKLAILLTLPSLGGLELNLLKFYKYHIKKLKLNTLLILAKGSAAEKWAVKEDLPFCIISKPRKYFSLKQVFELKNIILSSNCNRVFISSSQDLDLCTWLNFFSNKVATLKIIFYQQMQLGVPKKNFYHDWKFSHIDYWIAPLPWLKNELLAKTSIPEKKITVLPLCLDTQEFLLNYNATTKSDLRVKFNIPEDAVLFGIIGRIDPGKGQLEVIENFHHLLNQLQHQNKLINIKLCLIGSSTLEDENAKKYDEQVNQAIQSLHLEQHILRIPHIHQPAMIYKLLDILIVASQKETFGMVTVEGLLAKLILIGANSGGTVELLAHGQYGLLYDSKIKYDLSQKMLYAIENFDILKRKIVDTNFNEDYDFKRLEQFLAHTN